MSANVEKPNMKRKRATNSKPKLSIIEKAKQKMSSSMLRIIDESVYTSDANSVPMNKDQFEQYHKAYSDVCAKWPIQPIDYIVKFIKKRKIFDKKPMHKIKFADIGCGAKPQLKQKLPAGAKVTSLDVVSNHKDIVEANMISLPLEDNSIHCAVYSLSLMAKELGNVLLEAKRILKTGGSLIIVEVTSRFESREKRFIRLMERIGFKINSSKALPPNSYFTFFHFKKNDDKQDYLPSSTRIQLKPCVYKAR